MRRRYSFWGCFLCVLRGSECSQVGHFKCFLLLGKTYMAGSLFSHRWGAKERSILFLLCKGLFLDICFICFSIWEIIQTFHSQHLLSCHLFSSGKYLKLEREHFIIISYRTCLKNSYVTFLKYNSQWASEGFNTANGSAELNSCLCKSRFGHIYQMAEVSNRAGQQMEHHRVLLLQWHFSPQTLLFVSNWVHKQKHLAQFCFPWRTLHQVTNMTEVTFLGILGLINFVNRGTSA